MYETTLNIVKLENLQITRRKSIRQSIENCRLASGGLLLWQLIAQRRMSSSFVGEPHTYRVRRRLLRHPSERGDLCCCWSDVASVSVVVERTQVLQSSSIAEGVLLLRDETYSDGISETMDYEIDSITLNPIRSNPNGYLYCACANSVSKRITALTNQ